MVRIALFTFSLLLFKICAATSFERFLNSSVQSVTKFEAPPDDHNLIYVEMPFSSEIIVNPEKTLSIKEAIVLKIELVYTKYKFSESFNQKELNRKRLQQLQEHVPELFENPLWEFQLVEQTRGSSPEECDKMLHGFIITTRTACTAKSLNEEANYLLQLFANSVSPKNNMKDTASASTRKRYKITTNYDDKIGFVHDTVWANSEAINIPIDPPKFLQTSFIDSAVINSFSRNKWEKAVMVIDATGSMSPYIFQVLKWVEKESRKDNILLFTFFNDGDTKPFERKKTGSTGGIYSVENSSVENVLETADKCMRSGSGGGEGYENDIEAILESIKKTSEAEEVILVADNYEKMRDYELMWQINLPVRIVLCGARNGINAEYLDLAKQTKGSVHTGFSDIKNLYEVKENDIIKIDGLEYILKEGRFRYYIEEYQ